MVKLRFEIIVKAKLDDNKTNTYAITSITDTQNQTFVVPKEYQPAHLHKEIIKHEIFDKVRKSLQKRHDKRQVWITLTKEMESTYLDDGNLQFDGFLFEKLEQTNESLSIEPTLLKKPQNKMKLIAEFSIEKFSKNTTNVKQWLNIFESECARLEIDTDIKKIEILRLLMEDSCIDWYSSMIIKHTIDSDWSVWKESLSETFADKSWSPIKYAINFKYIQGSILEYALKKERLLLEINKSIDKQILIYLIATGLPNFITDKIDRESLKEVNDLYNCIRGLESLTRKYDTKKNLSTGNKYNKQEIKQIANKMCTICENKGKLNRFHPENVCWYNYKSKTTDDKNLNSNAILKVELSNEDPKKLEFPPLIEITVMLNNTLKAKGLYDPGSRITLINSKLVEVTTMKPNYCCHTIKTISGGGKTKGLITLDAELLNRKIKINAFIYENKNFEYDLILGLDSILKFGLTHDENLNIQIKKENNFTINSKNKSENKQTENMEINIEEKEYAVNFNEGIDTNKFNINTEHLNTDQAKQINLLIDSYTEIFAKNKYDTGKVKKYEACIDLQVEKYCYKRPYRCSVQDKIEIENQISQLLKHELIEESYSPFAAPVTLAFKRDEEKKSRLCIDFRDLNKIIIPQSQPFPLIEDLITKTINCNYFTTLDINSAFWSIPLKITDRYKTGFVTQEGHYQWTCLPFGLKTSPAIFQRILGNIIRKNGLTEFAVNFIDDILIFSNSFDEHITHLRRLLEAIRDEGFRLKFTKCKFASDSVKYLGHILQKNTITPLKDNLISIKKFPAPQNRKQIRQFLGKINFYGKYIPNVSIVLDPLHKLLRKNERFNWTTQCEDAFRKIKDYLCSKPILAIYNPKAPTFIYTDASAIGIGAVLKQIQHNGEEKPVAYFSKKINETQKNKKAIFLECLAIKESIKFWQHWLIGNYFTIYTDHKPLEKLNVRNRPDDELGDMLHYLSQYNCEIKYFPGKNNTEADCLSRNPVLDIDINNEDNLRTVNIIDIHDIKHDQAQNLQIKNHEKNIILEDGIYYKRRGKNRKKIVLSEDYSKAIIKKIHEKYCHTGINQTESKIKPFYTAPNLSENIKSICKNCEVCIKNKTRLNRKYGFISQLGPANKPFQIMSLDTIGGFGGKRSTKRYLHLLVDHFTRYTYILCSKNQHARDFIKLLEKIPKEETIDILLSDQYPAFNSIEFKKYLKNRNIQLILTAVDAPFSNGLNERLNQTIVNKIRCKLNESKKRTNWTKVAEECRKRYNETNHSVTGFSPEYLLSGESTDLLPHELKEKQLLRKSLEENRKTALQRSIKSHEYNKTLFAKNRLQYDFKKGDKVYVDYGNKLNKKKLDEIRFGPFEIEEKISDSVFKINTGRGRGSNRLYHVTKLIPMLNDF